MILSPQAMRLLIVSCMVGMALLAVFFLRQRRLTAPAYLGWGLLAVLLPFVGPFLVLLYCPGRLRRLSWDDIDLGLEH